MSELTVLNNSGPNKPAPLKPDRVRQKIVGILLHGLRVALLVLIVCIIHWQHQIRSSRNSSSELVINLQDVKSIIPAAMSLQSSPSNPGQLVVFDKDSNEIGYAIQTSPDSDHLIGFSGPTNCLVVIDNSGTIAGVKILSSKDTREHVRQIERDADFFDALCQLKITDAEAIANVDGVSGATLTSQAIQQSLIERFHGQSRSLRFSEALNVEAVRTLFPMAAEIQQSTNSSRCDVFDDQQSLIGWIMRSSPAADQVIGYQGPTEVLIAFGSDDQIRGFLLGKSYDNEPYITYIREDDYFKAMFNGHRTESLVGATLESLEVEGVSGATMTSQAVAESIIVAASDFENSLIPVIDKKNGLGELLDTSTIGTAIMIAFALVIGLTRMRGIKWLRIVFQLFLIVYLGLINGDLLSQAMFFGWAQSGVPWTRAMGLVLLTIVAFLIPMTSKRNIYCTHLCPHGAAQALLKNRFRFRLRIPRKISFLLKLIPAAILIWCFIVALCNLPFSLIDIEPFDAWVFYIAGWATISIAIIGLFLSCMIPMAYCRFGCPTGALLNYFRFNKRSDQWHWKDWFVVTLVTFALVALFYE